MLGILGSRYCGGGYGRSYDGSTLNESPQEPEQEQEQEPEPEIELLRFSLDEPTPAPAPATASLDPFASTSVLGTTAVQTNPFDMHDPFSIAPPPAPALDANWQQMQAKLAQQQAEIQNLQKQMRGAQIHAPSMNTQPAFPF